MMKFPVIVEVANTEIVALLPMETALILTYREAFARLTLTIFYLHRMGFLR